jgi:hypothetical protein
VSKDQNSETGRRIRRRRRRKRFVDLVAPGKNHNSCKILELKIALCPTLTTLTLRH